MSGQHLVGLVAADAVPADLAGDVIPCGAIAAAIRPARSRGAARDRLDHHAAVVAWSRRATLLPSRVGIAISPQLLQCIAQAARSYRSRLEHIADRVEISVELERRDNGVRRAAESGGRAYLRAAACDLTACEAGITTAAGLLVPFHRDYDGLF
jgi:GAF domain-containing protein